MNEAFLVGGLRSAFGRYGGALAEIRPDDLAAAVMGGVAVRYELAHDEVDEVILGCANQAGEDNRNVARMATLLSGLAVTTPGVTVNRLCGSGLEAIAFARRMIATGEADVVLAGGVESMSRAPYVMGKSPQPYGRNPEMFDSTLGWRFVNERLAREYGIHSMGETAEEVAEEFQISRVDQDRFALWSQAKTDRAMARGILAEEILPVHVGSHIVLVDEHPRATSLEKLGRLRPAFRMGGSVTAGNSSGINDGASVCIVASERAIERHGWDPLVRIRDTVTVGVPPRIMGIGPLRATEKLIAHTGVGVKDFDTIEINEAFSSQVLATLRGLGLSDDDERVNRNGGAIALGHPLGASGGRLALACAREMQRSGGRHGLVTMCIGVGQGIATLLEAP